MNLTLLIYRFRKHGLFETLLIFGNIGSHRKTKDLWAWGCEKLHAVILLYSESPGHRRTQLKGE